MVHHDDPQETSPMPAIDTPQDSAAPAPEQEKDGVN